MSLVGISIPDSHLGKTGLKDRKKSTNIIKYNKSSLDITLDSFAHSNIVTPEMAGRLDESGTDMLINEFNI